MLYKTSRGTKQPARSLHSKGNKEGGGLHLDRHSWWTPASTPRFARWSADWFASLNTCLAVTPLNPFIRFRLSTISAFSSASASLHPFNISMAILESPSIHRYSTPHSTANSSPSRSAYTSANNDLVVATGVAKAVMNSPSASRSRPPAPPLWLLPFTAPSRFSFTHPEQGRRQLTYRRDAKTGSLACFMGAILWGPYPWSPSPRGS